MKIPARKPHPYFLSAKFSCFFLYWHLGGLPRWHFATTSDTRRLSAHRFRSRPGCERWLTVPPRKAVMWFAGPDQVSGSGIGFNTSSTLEGWRLAISCPQEGKQLPLLVEIKCNRLLPESRLQDGRQAILCTSMSFSERIKFRKPQAYFWFKKCARLCLWRNKRPNL